MEDEALEKRVLHRSATSKWNEDNFGREQSSRQNLDNCCYVVHIKHHRHCEILKGRTLFLMELC